MPEPAPRHSAQGGAGGAVAARAGPGPAIELLALGTGLTLIAVLLARVPSWRAELGAFQALYAVAFAFYALVLLRAGHYRHVTLAAPIVLAVAVAARVALLPVTPTLSDDIYRYLWEGKVALVGESPYRVAPLSPRLAPVRDQDLFPRINHPELSAIYPPLSLAGFAMVAAVWPTVWAMKLWVVANDLAVVTLLLRWARGRGDNPVAVAAYAWCPLVLAEFAGSGHNDPAALVWLVAALMWAERHPLASAVALAAGALTKLAPLAALPFLWRRWPWGARLLALSFTGAGLAWFWVEARGGDSGLAAYWRTWRNNDLAFHYLATWTGDLARARWVAVGLLAWWVTTWAFGRAGQDPGRATRLTLRAGLLLSPVAHPWYFAWPLVLEPLGPSAPWILLSLTCVLSYGLLAPPAEGGAFHLSLAWRWVEYGVPLALAAALAIVARRRGTHRRARP